MDPKRCLLICALLVCAVPAQAELRTFTDTQGRTMKAEIVSASIGTLVAKLENGTAVNVPLDSLSDGDQAFLKTWRIDKANAANGANGGAGMVAVPVPPVDFKVTWTKDRQGGKARPAASTNAYISTLSEMWLCHFKITNPSQTTYEDVKMECRVYVRRGKGKPTPQPATLVDLPPIKAIQTVNVDSALFQLTGSATQNYSTRRDSGNGKVYSTPTHQTIEMDEIAGVSLVFKKNGIVIDQYESPGLK